MILTILAENFNRNIMRLAETNEVKFEALVELSRSEASGINETR